MNIDNKKRILSAIREFNTFEANLKELYRMREKAIIGEFGGMHQ